MTPAARGRTAAPAPPSSSDGQPRPTAGARLRDALLKPKPEPVAGPSGKVPTKDDPYPEKTSAELRNWIKYLDDQERLFTLIAAPLAAALSITSMVVGLHEAHAAHPAKGATTSPETVVILGVVSIALAIAVLVAGLLRRRSFAVFSLLFVGFGVESGLGILGVLPFWALALWMFMRSSKMQRALTTRGDHPRQQRARQRRAEQGRARAGRTSATASGRGTSRSQGRRTAPGTSGPAPSRRYTPPKPKDDRPRDRYHTNDPPNRRRRAGGAPGAPGVEQRP